MTPSPNATIGPAPASWLRRLGTSCGRHPVRVVLIWIVVLVVAMSTSHLTHATYSDSVTLSGTESNAGRTLLSANEPSATGNSGLVVFHSPHGTLNNYSSAITSAITNLTHVNHVVSATNPLAPASPAMSKDGTIAYATVNFSEQPKLLGSSYFSSLERATLPATNAGLQVEYGGGLDQLSRPQTKDVTSELIGIGVALLVLLLMFGSALGSVVPLLSAVLSVLIGLAILGIVAAAITFGTASPTLALMIGLGVGIDYAVFLTTRFRQLMIDGNDASEAAGLITATSGRAVLVAATTVSIAMLGLYASGMSFIGQLGLASVFGVICAAAGAVTLVPAGLALAGTSIDRWRVRTLVAESGSSSDSWHRYASMIGRHPWRYLTLGLATLTIVAVPFFSMQMGHVGDGADPTSFTDKRAYDLISTGFGPGANGPFTVVVDLAHYAGTVTSLATSLQSTLASTPGVAHASAFQPSPNGKLLVDTVVPRSGPQDQATTTLFTSLYQKVLPDVLYSTGARAYVVGSTASQIQFDALVAQRIALIVAVVIVLAFLLIMTAFRSLLLALKAAILNLFSIGAAYGVIVAVFQWGWGRSLIGIKENIPIEAYVPMMMFAIVFGLSMDYEIFLLSRVKEAWDTTHDNHQSVALGLSNTGRVISAAALIMISVFLSFVTSSLVVVKQLSIGLSASVLIDATIVRLLLVPSTMFLFGPLNWWLPAWLDRILPHLDVEGDHERSETVDA